MDKFILAVSFAIVNSAFLLISPAQAQFTDDFSDGDLTANPAWAGATDKFTIDDGRLRLQAPAETATAYLAVSSEAINTATWEFTVSLDFNPSSANYTQIYLVSDAPDLSGPVNGYFVRIGDTPDEVSLYEQTGTNSTRIINGADDRVDLPAVSVRIKVTRDEAGNWALYSDVGITGVYVEEGTASHTAHLASSYFGLYCNYTATRSDKFYFDDLIVSGDPFVDTSVQAAEKDVIITEIFADPSPPVGMPEAEFIEIYNRSANEFNLANWTVSDAASSATISPRMLAPGEYLLLVPSSALDLFASFENVMGLPGFPSLNNTGDEVVLRSAAQAVIDSVSYTDTWYRSIDKKQGGWSLELIDPDNPCSGEANWVASENEQGGTPAAQNSVFASKPDVTGPSLLRALALAPDHLRLEFSETLAEEEMAATGFTISPGVPVAHVSFAGQSLKKLDVITGAYLDYGTLYTITAANVRDCNGNMIQGDHNTAVFALPQTADSLDVVINEILFNPYPEGVDFVEIYNRSGKYINLKDWTVANASGDTRVVTYDDVLIGPDSFKVFTPDPEVLITRYPSGRKQNFMTVPLPSLPDDAGYVLIATGEGKPVDAVLYDEGMHSPFIKNDEGVSLERVAAGSPAADPQNWKSAGTTAGYATPGYINANAMPEAALPGDAVRVDPEIFQPVYGQPDFSRIHYRFDRGGYVANVKVYDVQGRTIKVLANNDVLAASGFYRWDGDREDGSKARTGYYVVWFEIFDETGAVKTFRKRVVVATQF